MKKIITIFLTAALSVSVTTSAFAASIPRESAPENAPEEAIQITENIIGGILDGVNEGTCEYAIGRANTLVRKAVIAGETGGYGYGLLSAITRNAIRTIRDMQLRPEMYQQTEEQLRVLLTDVIAEVENGKDYDEAVREAYILIYKSINPSFDPDVQFSIDTCYRDMPTVDMAVLSMARRLIINTQKNTSEIY